MQWFSWCRPSARALPFLNNYFLPGVVYYVNSEHYCKMRYHFGQIRPKQGVQFQFFSPINLRFSVSCLCCMYKASCHISRGGNTYIVFTYLKQFQFCTNQNLFVRYNQVYTQALYFSCYQFESDEFESDRFTFFFKVKLSLSKS